MGAALIASVPVAIAYNLFLDRFIAASPAAPSSSIDGRRDASSKPDADLEVEQPARHPLVAA